MLETLIKRMRQIDLDLIRHISVICVPVLRFDKSSIKIYCTRVPFGFAQDKLPVKFDKHTMRGTKIYFASSSLLTPSLCIIIFTSCITAVRAKIAPINQLR